MTVRESQVLAIAGMHRSGTSLTAQYLESCGLNIGQKLLSAQPSTESTSYLRGHHEDIEFLEFHKAVCWRNFKNSSAINIEKVKLPVTLTHREKRQATDIINSRQKLSQWSWKDPRTTLFLDFWKDMIPTIKYIILFREPLSVTESIVRRDDNKSISKCPVNGVKIWKLYNQEVLDFYEKFPENTMLYNIDDLIQDSDSFLKIAKSKLAINLRDIPIDNIFSKKLFKNQHSKLAKTLEVEHAYEVSSAKLLFERLKTASRD